MMRRMAEYTETFLWPPYGASSTDTTPNYFGIDMAINKDHSVVSVRDGITGNYTIYHTDNIYVKEERYPRRCYIYRLNKHTLIMAVARNVTDAEAMISSVDGYTHEDYVTSYPKPSILRSALGNQYKGRKVGVNIFLFKDVKTGVRKVIFGV